VVIHAVYLLNCAAEDRAIRTKSLASLTQSLRVGEAIGAHGVVVHPGSAKSGDVKRAIARAGKTIAAALADSERCPLYLENTAGAGGTLGRSVEELAALLEAAGGDGRLGVCLDSCHLLASGYEVRTPAGVDALLGEVRTKVGLARIGCLHLNDSQTPFASNRDRHANIGEGELGERGCAAFLGAPPFQDLPCLLETRGDGHGPSAAEVALAKKLHRRGVSARARAARGARPAAKRSARAR
jgi:deoxyribonuclease-4